MKEKDPNIKHQNILKIHSFVSLLTKDIDQKLDEETETGFSQCMILMYVKDNPGANQRNISEGRHITPAAVSRHIENLINKKYIKVSDKKNRKEHSLELSDRGMDMLQRMILIVNQELDSLFSDISRREMESMDRIFSRLLSDYFDTNE